MGKINNCFHCNEPIPEHTHLYADIDGKQQAMCCIGCQTVAEFIANSGMGNFYHLRNNLDQAQAVVNEQSNWSHYDSKAIQEEYVQTLSEEEVRVELLVEGLYCSACSWLIERQLHQLSGVTHLHVNTVGKRVIIQWNPKIEKLSHYLSALAQLGYRPRPLNFTDTENTQQEYRQALKRLTVAGFGMMQVMTYAIGLYMGEFQGIDATIERFLILVSMLIATVVVFYSGAPFFQHAYRDLRARHIGMDVPIALAIGAAYLASVYSTFFGSAQDVYFDSAVMFIFFLSISRFIDMLIRHKSINTRDVLLNMMPALVNVKRKNKQLALPCQKLRADDYVFIQTGDIVPADGISDAPCIMDESWLTGESTPQKKSANDLILAGSKNNGKPFTLTVIRSGKATALANIEHLLQQAQTSRPRIALLADKVASYFVIGILLLSTVLTITWWIIDSSQVFSIVLSTLIVTCPCALSLAIPSSLLATSQFLSRNGIIVTRNSCLEKLLKSKYWIFDKTGTLTNGQARVTKTDLYGQENHSHCLRIAAALEANSTHSIATAFSSYSNQLQAQQIDNIAGKGVRGFIDSQEYRLGNGAWLAEWCHDSQLKETISTLTHDNNVLSRHTLVFLATEHKLLSLFYIADSLRSDAKSTLDALRTKGKQCEILSGDQTAAVANIAQQLGVEHYRGSCLPEEKLSYLKNYWKDGELKPVVMVGDGINDAPALAAADVAISMGSGSELAQSNADVIIVGDRLNALNTVLTAAQKSLRISKQNILWAICYNLLALPLAASGLIAPWMAALGMSLSSLIVVLNAQRAGYLDNQKTSHIETNPIPELSS